MLFIVSIAEIKIAHRTTCIKGLYYWQYIWEPQSKYILVLHHVPYMIYVPLFKRKKHRLRLLKTQFVDIFLELAPWHYICHFKRNLHFNSQKRALVSYFLEQTFRGSKDLNKQKLLKNDTAYISCKKTELHCYIF